MNEYEQVNTAARRRLILDALATAPDYAITHPVLIGMMETRGYAGSYTRADLVWLEERGLIINSMTGPDRSVPESVITPAGEDVAHGRISVIGVDRRRRGS